MINPKFPYIAIDTETTGLTPWGDFKRWGFEPARPFAFSFCDWDGETLYVRWKVEPFTRRVLRVEGDYKRIKALCENPKTTKILHNASFDIRMLKMIGIEMKGKVHDTLIMMHVYTGGRELTYALKPLSKKYMGFSDDDEKELEHSVVEARRKGKKLGWCMANKEGGVFGGKPLKADFWMADPKLCEKYAVQDAERAMMLFRLMKPEFENDPDMMRVYLKEMELTKLVARMEERGTRVFPDSIASLRKEYADYMAKQLKEAEKHGGKGLNFRSPKQMCHKFYVERGIPVKLGKKSGNPSVDGEKLRELAATDPLAKAILEYKGGAHMLSAFLDPYERFRVNENGVWVLHPNYRQCGPVTGRFSCAEPNLMNVASETTGRRMTTVTLRPREAFGPRPGCLWYLVDYSQIEVWIFAFFSQEPHMIEALLSGHDFHGAVAQKAWGHLPDFQERRPVYRTRAKLVMFSKLYGGGTKQIASLTGTEYDEAVKFVADYERELPGVKTFIRKMIDIAERDGQIKNPFGRTYHIDDGFAYRSVNYIVQGTAADIMKNAMIRVQKMLDARWPGVQILLTLHDELAIEVPFKYHSKKLMREIIHEMQEDYKVLGLPVRFPMDVEVVKSRWNKPDALCRAHLNYVKTCSASRECIEKRKKG